MINNIYQQGELHLGIHGYAGVYSGKNSETYRDDNVFFIHKG